MSCDVIREQVIKVCIFCEVVNGERHRVAQYYTSSINVTQYIST